MERSDNIENVEKNQIIEKLLNSKDADEEIIMLRKSQLRFYPDALSEQEMKYLDNIMNKEKVKM